MTRRLYLPVHVPVHAVLASCVAGLAVAGPLVFGIVLLGVLAAVVLIEALRVAGAGRRIEAAVTAGVHAVVAGGIVAAAVAAPGKTVDVLRARPVSLPATAMTLGDLDEWAQSPESRDALPIRTSWNLHAHKKGQVVRWPARVVTLGEFIETVEGQTALRHRFAGCGTCATILTGNDCSFGLMFRDPERPFSVP